MIIFAILVLITILLTILAMKPFRLRSEFISKPISNYEEASARIREVQTEEKSIEELRKDK